MKKIIFVSCHQGVSVWNLDLNIALTESMAAVAKKVSEDTETPDFIILSDPVVCDIVLSNQSFFDHKMEEELQKAGVNITVQGVCGGDIQEALLRHYPDYKGDLSCYKDPLLYVVTKK